MPVVFPLAEDICPLSSSPPPSNSCYPSQADTSIITLIYDIRNGGIKSVALFNYWQRIEIIFYQLKNIATGDFHFQISHCMSCLSAAESDLQLSESGSESDAWAGHQPAWSVQDL